MAETSKNEVAKKGRKGGMSGAMLAGVAGGALVGAALGGAAAVALSDKKTREKVGEIASDVTTYAADVLEEATNDIQTNPGRDAHGRFMPKASEK
jgi:gas vesicle protein